MGFRYRKSLRLSRGVRLNITKHGLSSVSIGRRGSMLNVGSNGVRQTIGLPGTGLSYTTGTRGNAGLIIALLALVTGTIGASVLLIRSALKGNRISQAALCGLIALGLFSYLRYPNTNEVVSGSQAEAATHPTQAAVVPATVTGQSAPGTTVAAIEPAPISHRPSDASIQVDNAMLTMTGANLRSEASPHAPVIRQLSAGATVHVIGGEGRWAQVQVTDGGNIGWVSWSLLRKP